MKLLADIEAYIGKRFPESQVSVASALVAGAVIEDGTPASPRLQRCALLASEGSLERLQYYVELLAIDWRDVILAGEYIPGGADPVRVRNLEEAFSAKIDQAAP